MSFAGIRWQRWLVPMVLWALLMGSMDLSIAQQTDGEVPFFNDSGSLTLPPNSDVEMDEAMPELQLFPPQNPGPNLPQVGEPLGSPDL
ncbi:MAG: hypothetical protein ER33_14995 [Cyanobium sp. CACIAM 14]|nr:MAG: hypothetical protein ER33_14995 [Cyanobium sp. CACIAM 14]